MKKARRTLRRIARRPLLIVGVVIVLGVLLVAALADVISPYNPLKSDLLHALEEPSTGHPFGTDPLGRDILSRVIHGSRVSVVTGVFVVSLASGLGSVAGCVAGFFGGVADLAIMRLVDILIAFPYLILAMALTATLGPSLGNAMIALIIVWWPRYARMMRGQVLHTVNEDYVEAARALGAGPLRIVVRHVVPNCFEPVLIKGTLDIGITIMYAAALSFIGLGAQPPTPEWGAMVSESRTYILFAWWYTTFPGLAIFLATLGFNLLGDGIRDLLEPTGLKT